MLMFSGLGFRLRSYPTPSTILAVVYVFDDLEIDLQDKLESGFDLIRACSLCRTI